MVTRHPPGRHQKHWPQRKLNRVPPVVAIGVINADNAAAVVRSGVDSIAVVSCLYDCSNPYDTALRLAAICNSHSYF
ncbi:MAG: hypothetical protein HKN70_12600 [Gammaproteobacteria bacterium]|nr:hypothetical protein [Gammaproteobacteria bacterium]